MNKVILMGRLTKDPEFRTTKTSKHVVHFMIAVKRRNTKEGGQSADFLPVTAWGTLADFSSKYFKKGQQISVVGRSQSSSWQDADGKKHYGVDIVADELYFAEGKKNRNELTEIEIEDENEINDEENVI